MPTSSSPHHIPSCLASDVHSLGMTVLEGKAGPCHLVPENHWVAAWGAGLGQGLIQSCF